MAIHQNKKMEVKTIACNKTKHEGGYQKQSSYMCADKTKYINFCIEYTINTL